MTAIAERKVKKYGWRPGLPDPRDLTFGLEERVFDASRLPSHHSLRAEMPAVYDQGQLGSCTANADGAILEHAERKAGRTPVMPSRLFLYYEERRVGGYPLGEDTGAEVRDGIKVAAKEGVAPEQDWPYDISKFAQQPPAKAYTDATKYEALTYKNIVATMPGAPMRSALYQGFPIAFGFPVPDTFEDGSWDPATEPLPLPGTTTQIIGGHAVVVVGWDYTRTRFKANVFEIRNSWGPDWGDAGHFYMPSGWFSTWRNLASDLWTITTLR